MKRPNRNGNITIMVVAYCLFVFGLVWLNRAHGAETLTPAAAPTDWPFLGLVVLVALLAAAVVYLWRHHPGAVAKAKGELAGAIAEAETLKAGTAAVIGDVTGVVKQLAGVVEMLGAHVKALTPAPVQPAAEPAAPAPEPAPAGKAGQAGKLAIDVTGDPAVDLPAITAAYYAKG